MLEQQIKSEEELRLAQEQNALAIQKQLKEKVSSLSNENNEVCAAVKIMDEKLQLAILKTDDFVDSDVFKSFDNDQ